MTTLKPCHNRLRHGHTRKTEKGRSTPTYRSWAAMRSRCRLRSRHNFSRYSALGYDKRWDSFDNFLADMGERKHGTTLDRIDNSIGYCAENCRWATPVEQSRNRVGKTNRITFQQALEMVRMKLGKGLHYKEIAEHFRVSASLPREIVAGRAWRDALAAYHMEAKNAE